MGKISSTKRNMEDARKMLLQELKNSGVEVGLSESYYQLEEESVKKVEELLSGKPKALKMWRMMCQDDEVRANWDMADFIAVTKLHYNDHGEVHAKVVAASALSMLSILANAGIEPDVAASGAGDDDDAALVVMAGALCHDFGNQVHRKNHAEISTYLSIPILDRMLKQIYEDAEKRTEIRSFILSAIHTHDGEPEPLTMEAGLVCVGDATDMTKGRGRMGFDLGNINIHTVSALSIEKVSIIEENAEKPIKISVLLNNSAGIFQVQETLGRKVALSPLAPYINVVAATEKEEYDKKIIYGIEMKGKKFVPYGLKK